MPAPSSGSDPELAFSTILTFAHDLADAAGRAILPSFRRKLRVSNKARDGGFDPVTTADRAAERAIAKLIKRRFPEHGIVGEELGSTRPNARYKWIIDPIDGTRAFMTGSPLWGTLIGLMDDTAPVLGMVDQPYTRERVWCDKRFAFMRDGAGTTRRLKTRECRTLTDAVLMTTDPDLFMPGVEAKRFRRVKDKVRMVRYGGDCYAYCLLAAGHIDVIVEAGLKPHDVAALIPIIERAGGVFTTWDGGPAHAGGRIVAAGDDRVHKAALKLVAG